MKTNTLIIAALALGAGFYFATRNKQPGGSLPGMLGVGARSYGACNCANGSQCVSSASGTCECCNTGIRRSNYDFLRPVNAPQAGQFNYATGGFPMSM